MKDVVFISDFLRAGVDPGRAYIKKLVQTPLSVLKDIVGGEGKLKDFEHEATLIGFELEQFRLLVGADWVSSFWGLERAAKEYIYQYLSLDSVYVGYEISPWLIEVLDDVGASWVDIRLSPYRFSRDLYFSVRASSNIALAGISARSINRDVLKLEAGLVKAAVAHNVHKRLVPDLEGAVVFFGQTSGDASLIDKSGEVLTLSNYVSKIELLCKNKRLLYKPHPYAGQHSKWEITQFKRILGYRPSILKFDTYSLLSVDHEFSIFAISSGVCLEADIFEKKADFLFKPICQPLGDGWVNISIYDFYSPWFWSVILCMDDELGQLLPALPACDSNLVRRTHNAWWGYSDFVFENDDFWRKSASYGFKKMLGNVFKWWRYGP